MSGKSYVQGSILVALLNEGTASRPQLHALIGCGEASVYKAMTSLTEQGLLQEAAIELRTNQLKVFGLTKAGIDAALAIDLNDVEQA